MEKINTIGLFHTPKTMDELQDWLAKTRDPAVMTGAMMMFNYMATVHNDMIDKESI